MVLWFFVCVFVGMSVWLFVDFFFFFVCVLWFVWWFVFDLIFWRLVWSKFLPLPHESLLSCHLSKPSPSNHPLRDNKSKWLGHLEVADQSPKPDSPHKDGHQSQTHRGKTKHTPIPAPWYSREYHPAAVSSTCCQCDSFIFQRIRVGTFPPPLSQASSLFFLLPEVERNELSMGGVEVQEEG